MYKTRNKRIIRKYFKLFKEFASLDSFLYCECERMGMNFNGEPYIKDFSRLETLRSRMLRYEREYGVEPLRLY